jgi:transcriptional regulator with XRE-family HTH domain
MTRSKIRYQAELRHLSGALRNARRGSRLSQQSLAERAQISIGTVRNLEQQIVGDPGFFEVAAIAAVLGVSLDTLVDDPMKGALRNRSDEPGN